MPTLRWWNFEGGKKKGKNSVTLPYSSICSKSRHLFTFYLIYFVHTGSTLLTFSPLWLSSSGAGTWLALGGGRLFEAGAASAFEVQEGGRRGMKAEHPDMTGRWSINDFLFGGCLWRWPTGWRMCRSASYCVDKCCWRCRNPRGEKWLKKVKETLSIF